MNRLRKRLGQWVCHHNEKTGKSTSIDADSMWFESQATSEERHSQEVQK
jgi:hypothetical protein